MAIAKLQTFMHLVILVAEANSKCDFCLVDDCIYQMDCSSFESLPASLIMCPCAAVDGLTGVIIHGRKCLVSHFRFKIQICFVGFYRSVCWLCLLVNVQSG